MKNRLGNFCSNCGLAKEATAAASESKSQVKSGSYHLLFELPELFTKRCLSDKDVKALKNADLETLRNKISTPADFAAWIDTQNGTYISNIISNDEGQRTYGADFNFPW